MRFGVLVGILVVASGFGGLGVQHEGKMIYKKYCTRCHGGDGTRGMFGAKNLRKSVLVEAAVRKQIVEGKGIMPPFGEKLRDGEVEALVVYVMSLRLQVPR